MPIPAEDQALLRTSAAHRVRQYLNIWPKNIIATAQLNQSAFGYPLGSVSIDNLSANFTTIVKAGMLVLIGTTPGVYDVTVSVVRKAPTSNTLYISGISLGDSGWARSIANGLEDNQYVSVIESYPIWSLLSRIVSRTFFKQFDISYSGQGSNPSPVVNIGDWRWALVNSASDTASFTFTNANSYAWSTKTLTTYAWEVPAGVTNLTGSTTQSSIELEFPVGFYLVGCTVTDSGGATQRAVRPVWVKTRTGVNAAFGSQYRWTIGSDRQDLQGRQMNVSVYAERGELTDDVLFPGMAFCMGEEAYYGTGQLATGIAADTYAGFWSESTQIGESRKNALDILIRSPYQILSEVPMVSQAIIEKASPANWTEVSTGLADPNFLVWYVLKHHVPNFLLLFDYFRISPTPPRKRSYALNGTSASAQLEEISALLGANIGSSSSGALYFRRDPMKEDLDFRDALDTRMTLSDGDVREDITFPRKLRNRIGQLIMYGFVLVNNTPVPIASVAPGRAQAQAPGRTQGQNILPASQDDLNERSGNYWAIENAPTPEVVLKMDRNFNVFDPARLYNAWWDSNFSARYDPRGIGYTDRLLNKSVERSWSPSEGGALLPRINAVFAPETFGQRGETMPVNRGGAANAQWDLIYQIPEEYENVTQATGFAWNRDGLLARSFNLTNITSGSTWDLIMDGVEGSVNDMALNWFSTLVLSGFLEGTLGAWITTITGTSWRIYYSEDILANVVLWTEQALYTLPDGTADENARIVASREEENFVVAAVKDGTGTRYVRTTDGATWNGSLQRAGSSISDTADNNNADLGLDVHGVVQLLSAPTGVGDWELFIATSTGGSFSAVTNSEVSLSPSPMIVMDKADASPVAYVSVKGPGGGTFTVTFDGGAEHSDYTFISGSSTTGGNPGNRAGSSGSYSGGSPTGDTDLNLYLDFVSPVVISHVQMDIKVDWAGSTPNNTDNVLTIDIDRTGWSANDATGVSTGIIVGGATIDNYSAADFLTRDGVWSTLSRDFIPNATALSFQVGINLTGSFTTTNGNSWTLSIDNIVITTVDNQMYRVATYTGASTWTDITAPPGFMAFTPYGLAVDRGDINNLMLLGRTSPAADQAILFVSTDQGDTFTERDGTLVGPSGLRYSSGIAFFWGDGTQATEDDGVTAPDITGNLEATLGALDVRGLIALL